MRQLPGERQALFGARQPVIGEPKVPQRPPQLDPADDPGMLAKERKAFSRGARNGISAPNAVFQVLARR
jgi:hypothetical protein